MQAIPKHLLINEHPAFVRLAATCAATIRPIDHLITAGNNSTTLTLAYVEAIRVAGRMGPSRSGCCGRGCVLIPRTDRDG